MPGTYLQVVQKKKSEKAKCGKMITFGESKVKGMWNSVPLVLFLKPEISK